MKTLVLTALLLMAGLTVFVIYYAVPDEEVFAEPFVRLQISRPPERLATRTRVEEPSAPREAPVDAGQASQRLPQTPQQGGRSGQSDLASANTGSGNGAIEVPQGLSLGGGGYGVTVSVPPTSEEISVPGISIIPPPPVPARRRN